MRKFSSARLQETRKIAGFTQSSFADAIGSKFRTVQDWEHGKSAPVGDILRTIARVLKKPTDYFFEPETESYKILAGQDAASAIQAPIPVLTLKSALPPSKTKLIRQARMHLRKVMQIFATEQAEGVDRESAMRAMSKAQRDVLAALDELDRLEE